MSRSQKYVSSRQETTHELEIGYGLLVGLFEGGPQTVKLDNGERMEITASKQTADAVDYLSDAYDQNELYKLANND